MKKKVKWLLLLVVLLSSCYCEKQYRGYSSARQLKVVHTDYFCHEPYGLKDGKSLLLTAYVSDPALTELKFSLIKSDSLVGRINYTDEYNFGVRGETFFYTGTYPGPLLGIGLDYSGNYFTAGYTAVNGYAVTRQEKQQRLLLSFNLVTWIKKRMMGSLSFQPGLQLTNENMYYDLYPQKTMQKQHRYSFSCRIGYGFQFYISKRLAVNLETGIGGGSFVRGGLSFWLI